MDSIYEKEMFNYITIEKNFETAFELVRLFPKVKNTLIKETWEAVISKLKKDSEGTVWSVHSDQNSAGVYTKLWLQHQDIHKEITVAAQNLVGNYYFGLTLPKLDTDKLNKIKEYAKNLESLKGFTAGSTWLRYRYSGVNLVELKALKLLLPDRREAFVNDRVKELLDLAYELTEDVVQMHKLAR